MFILEKKLIIVIIKFSYTNPRNISKKKFFWMFNLIILPYPDIDTDTKIILIIKISI